MNLRYMFNFKLNQITKIMNELTNVWLFIVAFLAEENFK